MMEQLPDNNAGQGDSVAVNPAISLGVTLREAREHLGLSVADVAEQIKFAPRQIVALEADDFQHLPEIAFVRGFVRSYARILQLDARPLLALMPENNAIPAQPVPVSIGTPFNEAQASQRQNKLWLGAALLLGVLAVVFAVWNFTTPVEKPETTLVEATVPLPAEIHITPASAVPETDVNASSVPAVTALQTATGAQQPLAPAAKLPVPQAAPQIQPAKPLTRSGATPGITALRLAFDETSWVEIKDKEGRMLSSQTSPRGSELRVEGYAPFSLVIGRAAGVRLYLREKQVDLKPYTGVDVARLTLE